MYVACPFFQSSSTYRTASLTIASRIVAGLILLGLVYKHLDEEMKLLWSPDLPKNSINMADMAGIVWAAAKYVMVLIHPSVQSH
jgi:hypothetical protein